jgi:very-short-patch-repair endonuclease
MNYARSGDEEIILAELTSRARDPELVATTARLVAFLRDLAMARRSRVRDVDGNRQVIWLSDLPADIMPYEEAGPGKVLLEVPPAPPGERPPAPPESLRGLIDDASLADYTLPAPELNEYGPAEVTDAVESAIADGEHTLAVNDARDIEGAEGADGANDHGVNAAHGVDGAAAAALAPGQQAEYDAWLPSWQAWARREAAVARQRSLHRTLFSIANRLSQADDEIELVLAVGLFAWQAPDGTQVRNHLLTTRLQAVFDPDTEHIQVIVDPDAWLRLQDQQLLEGCEGFDRARAATLAEVVRNTDPLPLSSQAGALLEQWCSRAMSVRTRYDADWSPQDAATPAPEVRFAPALVLRRRDRASLVGYYDSMLAALSGPEAAAPLGLAQLVTALEPEERLEFLAEQGSTLLLAPDSPATPAGEDGAVSAGGQAEEQAGGQAEEQAGGQAEEQADDGADADVGDGADGPVGARGDAGMLSDEPGDQPLFPLPANPEQRGILERLRRDNGVVVQGPPGTGKTHTIANLVSALLAQGQRVLVTSQKAQALRVLRDKLPAEIAQLCVSMTDLTRGGSVELEGSVKAMSGRHASFDPIVHELNVAEAGERLAAARRRIAGLREQIVALREEETYSHGEIAPGYDGTMAEIARRLKLREPECSWMPVPLPEHAPQDPPVSGEEAAELLGLLANQTPQRKARAVQVLPDPADLPGGARVRELIDAERLARAVAEQASTSLSQKLLQVGEELAGQLEVQHSAVSRAVHQLGLGEDWREWDGADWVVRALTDGFAGREITVWAQLSEHAAGAREAKQALRAVGYREVTLPPLEAAGPASTAALLRAARGLREFLSQGGQLKRGPIKPAAQKQAALILNASLVDGETPANPELLDVIIAELEGRTRCAALRRGWRDVGVEFPEGLPLARTVAQLEDAFGRLGLVLDACEARRETARLLESAGIHVALGTPEEWSTYGSALMAARRRLEAESATAALAELEALLRAPVGSAGPGGRPPVPPESWQAPPELAQACAAVAARDPDAYERALGAIAGAHREKQEEAHAAELMARVSAAHPGLAALIAARPGDQCWPGRLGAWDMAWAWGKAATYFTAQRAPGLEQRLEAEYVDATKRLERVTAELAAEKAWGHCLRRMTAHRAQALRSYEQHMRAFGKGTGRYAPRFRARAREAMREAGEAVPAWIMPLRQVVETIPPVRDSFDVVIVDEASQASIESLFLLWLAPRVIVVGDDKQCAPSVVSHGELEPLFARLTAYLPNMPGYLRDVFTPKSSLFDLLATRFGSIIRLREHFRCMPEIIEYSSRQFYGDDPLVPLRQFGADRLPPLQLVHVADAVSEGTATRLHNQAEARAIAMRLTHCLADPAYAGKTFGVVVLQGTGQVEFLHDMLLELVEPREWERRRLRVGTPPDFQGDERDVVFLSMVVAGRRPAVTSKEWQRRFNVAASRARDQLWLFHSVNLGALSQVDLRRSLLTYMNTPPVLGIGTQPEDVTTDAPHPAFDSVFEQRVFLALRESGYHVVPQVNVNGRRIDLVITGSRGRMAVECDGDTWRDSAKQREAEFDRENELRRVGWEFWRIRESEFCYDSEQTLVLLRERLERRGIYPYRIDSSGEPTVKLTVSPSEPDGVWSAMYLPDSEGWDGLEGDDPGKIDDVRLGRAWDGVRRFVDRLGAALPPSR